MRRLTEDKAKDLLREEGLPVPRGVAVSGADAAAEAARGFPGGCVVKALVALGRRGKAGAIHMVDGADAAAKAARDILGKTIHGLPVDRVYVEEKFPIACEYYLSLAIEAYPPQLLISARGGVEIEETFAEDPGAVIVRDLDPVAGLSAAAAMDHWRDAGVADAHLESLGEITAQLFRVFRSRDAITLEINPLAVDGAGNVSLVGAMMAIEDPMFQHADTGGMAGAGRDLTPRERSVAEANIRHPGGLMRFTELDGDIGLYIGGGGASLLQHDLILELGGRPANHTDSSTVNGDKIRALINAILDTPNVKSLLVSWHFQQMGRIDRRVIPVIDVLKERGIDPQKFPVVIRMFGPGEADARRAAATLPGIRYLDPGTPIEDAVRLIVKLTNELGEKGAPS